MKKYILGVDQSTQGTKALLFDQEGRLICRRDISHRQIVNDKGWVEHDPAEIYSHMIQAVRELIAKSGIGKSEIAGLGISNQRETVMAWDKDTGEPLYNAVVWQCARGEKICGQLNKKGCAELIRRKTGLRLSPGMIKATYGTGSSIMMNIGEHPIFCREGVVTSLAWSMHGKVNYVLEGNINYTGAVISWLKDDLKLIRSPEETEGLAKAANDEDRTYLVPAFSGLGAPYWDANARAVLCGMSRITGKNELVRAALDSICYQIGDVVGLMEQASKIKIEELRVDGGPTKNNYLMQFQSSLLNITVRVPQLEELSGIGAAFAAGLALGIYSEKKLFEDMAGKIYAPDMGEKLRREKKEGWRAALGMVVSR